MKTPKTFKIKMTNSNRRPNSEYFHEGTLPELIEIYRYTLDCGASWAGDGRPKINKNPKSVKALITNLNKAVNNSAANGYAGKHYELVENS